MHSFLGIVLLSWFFFSAVVSAEVQSFTATHTYILGDHDSKDDARQRCLLEVKRKVLEQAGVYIESTSEVKSMHLNKDQITTLSAAIMHVKDIKETVGFENDHLTLTLAVKADVDLTEMQKQVATGQVGKGLQSEITAQNERLKRVEMQLEVLRRLRGEKAPEGNVPLVYAPPAKIQEPAAGAGYLAKVQQLISGQWLEPPGISTFIRDKAVIKFRVNKLGRVSRLEIETSSGDSNFDTSCLRAVLNASPLPPFPKDFAESSLEVHFTFMTGE